MLDIGSATFKWAKKNHSYCIFEEKLSSTNGMAKAAGIVEDLDFWMYVTNHQSNGRGRGGHLWENTSKLGHQLLSTWCYRLQTFPQPISSPLFGWAVYKALSRQFDLSLSIKAPNDICIRSKKVGGILLESLCQGSNHLIFVGLGINVFSYPKNIETATSLCHGIENDIEESRWHTFLSHIKSNFDEAIRICTENKIPLPIRQEILNGLKKWPSNEVTHILSDGTLVLKNLEKIHWIDL